MPAWLHQLNRQHLHLSVLALAVALIILVISLAAVSLKQYFFWGTNFSINFVGRDAVLKFSLPEEDKRNLNNLTQALNLDWKGEDLSIELGATDLAKWQSLLPAQAKLNFPSNSEMVLHATTHNLPLSPTTYLAAEDRFVPSDALAVFSSVGVEKIYNLSGKEIFTEISGRPTLAFVNHDKTSWLLIASVKNQATLDAKLNNLKNNSGSPVLGYSSQEGIPSGFNETDVGGIKTYTLTRPDLKYQPTFGDVSGKLLVASSPEAWQAAESAYQSGQGLNANPKYQQALSSAPKFGAGFVYLDLTALAGRGAKLPADLAPFATVKIDESWLNTSIDAGKLDYMEAAWFGLDPAQTGVGQSELWVRIKSK